MNRYDRAAWLLRWSNWFGPSAVLVFLAFVFAATIAGLCPPEEPMDTPDPPKVILPPAPPLPEDEEVTEGALAQSESILDLESCPGPGGAPLDGGAYLDFRRRRFVHAARVRREALAILRRVYQQGV